MKSRVKLILFLVVVLRSQVGLPADQSATSSRARAELKGLGTTYNRAQSATWLAENRFVVGRWDGTIGVFRPKSRDDEFGPVLVQPLAAPARKGIELVARIDEKRFVTSNDSASLVLWQQQGNTFKGDTVAYPLEYGVAVSAASVPTKLGLVMVVGHTEGYVSNWSIENGDLRFVKGVSIRSPNPIEWEWRTWHVRGVAAYEEGKVVTVAEDGDICLISVPEGRVLSRIRYNPVAQRGMNDVAVCDNIVAIVNCSVGSGDRNLWVYEVERNQLTVLASTNLIQDTSRAQVFAFSIELVPFQGDTHFLVSTEEGVLWLGRIENGIIHVDTHAKVAADGGAVLALHRESLTILSVAHDIQTFTLAPKPAEQPATKAPATK